MHQQKKGYTKTIYSVEWQTLSHQKESIIHMPDIRNEVSEKYIQWKKGKCKISYTSWFDLCEVRSRTNYVRKPMLKTKRTKTKNPEILVASGGGGRGKWKKHKRTFWSDGNIPTGCGFKKCIHFSKLYGQDLWI